ncbi:MAG TPA: ferric reductase-like transmembrane domain-containing protein [Candidatus Dormibacteraeota bacterium]|nr:ferric reductase-like transmembrane domain-containing protein [Candidatus Dormibacteraeota bacterium]
MPDQLLWYTARGAGAVSLVLLTAVLVLGVLSSLRYRFAGRPRFLTTGFHRNLALVTVAFLALHIVTAVVDPFTNLGWVSAIVPFSSYYRTFWLGLGTIAMELFVALIVSSLLRASIGNRTWKFIHWVAYAAWPVAVVHGLGTGTDAWAVWFFALTCACIGAAGFAVVYRLIEDPVDPAPMQRAR